MCVAVEKHLATALWREVAFVDDVSVCEEDAVLSIGNDSIGTHDGEGEEHLVDLAVTVAPNGNDVFLVF